MRPFRDLPIQRKLAITILGTSGVVLLLTCLGFIGYEVFTYRRAAIRELSTLSAIIAAQSTAAVAFDNPGDAQEILAALRAEPHIIAAALYDKNGRLFARYPARIADSLLPSRPEPDGYRFYGSSLVGFTPVVQLAGSDRFGTLFVRSDLSAINERLRLYGIIVLLVVGVSGTAAYVLARFSQRHLSLPILNLADTARAASRGDYSVRSEKHGDDELGLLTDAFNAMLERIGEQNENLERRVRERTAELEAANAELEAFGSSAAHDLRTPLRAISGFAELLMNERFAPASPEGKRYVESINRGSLQMGQLIDDLLAFSRIGRHELKRRTVDIENLCSEVLADATSEIRARGAEIALRPLPPVYADRSLLRIALVNLVSNALKYSRTRQPPRIEIGAVSSGSDTEAVIYIKDNGVGFDMQDAGKLFGVFQRLHHAHEFEGTGVGLATVRRIIERHGGRIWAEARKGDGATFFFAMPLRSIEHRQI